MCEVSCKFWKKARLESNTLESSLNFTPLLQNLATKPCKAESK
ncbi:hypothetical protein [Helicobacter canis]|nr:hypothetical protein [Helicobacter canis]